MIKQILRHKKQGEIVMVDFIKEGFTIENGSLIDANGNKFIMRGINHAHTWYKDYIDDALSAIAGTGANCVRIVLCAGHHDEWRGDSAESIGSIIEKCKSHKMIVILEPHDSTGKDEFEPLEKCVDYIIENKDVFIGQEQYVIVNIGNEWPGKCDADMWCKGYTEAVSRIRASGIKNTLMIDSAGWGQWGYCIEAKGMEVFESDPMRNTMFSVHMYGSAGGSKESIEQNIKYATDQGLCVCVGEFGHRHSDGEVDEDYIMQYCRENSIGYLAWSWKGNSGGVEYLDLALDWEGNELSDDWGKVVIDGTNGIRETSQICTVY